MDHLFKLIAEREKDFPGALLEARCMLLERLEDAQGGLPGDGENLSLAAEVEFWLGTNCKDERQSQNHLADGANYGKKAVMLTPDSVAANFWYASCMAAQARLSGMTNSILCLETIEKVGNRAVEIDETYLGAGPLRLMARFYSTAPVSPVGPGDRKKGLELARRALELEPGCTGNKVVLAEAYLAARYFDKSRRLLRDIQAVAEPDKFRLSHARHLAEARQILERLERME